MAHGVSDHRVPLQQTLHGYSEGHRLLASSIDLPARDAKTVLMMSDASGPAATIGEEGYLTGYPLPESGHFALARTWPAPEMPRPGCVWTHTILVDFSDIPDLRSAAGLLKLFRRPRGDEQFYKSELTYVVSEGETSGKSFDDLARRILFAVYSNPMKPIISAASDVPTRDELVLAIWGQQWPRLRRAFRFCTLSFADRSSGSAVFDLQFLPALGRVRSAQFKSAIDADRQDFVAPEWLDDAVADLREGADGSLRRFLRAAGSDVGGRESFAPLATLHALSLHFASDPSAVERAISILERTISDDQGHAARSLITRAAASAADYLGQEGLKFVIRNFELIEPAEANAAAERVGCALWRIEPKAVFGILSDPARSSIAELAIAAMPKPALIEGIASTPMHLIDLVGLRPDLATETAYWALPEASKHDLLNSIGARPDIAQGAIDAMVRSGKPLAREARATFGSDAVLRRLISFVDGDPEAAEQTARAWLPTLVSDADAVARVLVEATIGSFDTLEAIARVVGPDAVPNTIGEDPWLTAVRRISASVPRPYLATFLLVRAFGRRSRSSAELVQSTFDPVYTTVEGASLADDAWQLLDHRLYRSYWWPSWDKCRRILQTTVDMYMDREIDASFFLKITTRDDVFAALVDIVANNYGGQRYLKSIRDRLTDRGIAGERLRAVKRVIW
jgi:GTPase-associated protein 1